ncbi:hypothetical protein PG984_001657 [Apiospora sp. TS-2023a]
MASPGGLSPSRCRQALQAVLRHVVLLLLSVRLVEGEFDKGPAAKNGAPVGGERSRDDGLTGSEGRVNQHILRGLGDDG